MFGDATSRMTSCASIRTYRSYPRPVVAGFDRASRASDRHGSGNDSRETSLETRSRRSPARPGIPRVQAVESDRPRREGFRPRSPRDPSPPDIGAGTPPSRQRPGPSGSRARSGPGGHRRPRQSPAPPRKSGKHHAALSGPDQPFSGYPAGPGTTSGDILPAIETGHDPARRASTRMTVARETPDSPVHTGVRPSIYGPCPPVRPQPPRRNPGPIRARHQAKARPTSPADNGGIMVTRQSPLCRRRADRRNSRDP